LLVTKSRYTRDVAALQKAVDTLKAQNSQLQTQVASLNVEIGYQIMFKDQLLEQIKDLRSVVYPPKATELTPQTIEFDSVISASEKPSDISEEEQSAILAGIREQDLLLSGNYDLEMLN
jgi:hypothetical protein